MVGEKLFPFMKKKWQQRNKKKNNNKRDFFFFFFSLDSALDFSIRHNIRAVQER